MLITGLMAKKLTRGRAGRQFGWQLHLQFTSQVPRWLTPAKKPGLEQIFSRSFPDKFTGSVTVYINIISAVAMKALNSRYRAERRSTDVISVNLSVRDKFIEPEKSIGELGEIYLNQNWLNRLPYGRRVKEAKLLVVHGLLHLLGFDHFTPRARKLMFAWQEKILDLLLNKVSSRPAMLRDKLKN